MLAPAATPVAHMIRGGFVPLRQLAPSQGDPRTDRQFARIERAWGWIVGPALVRHTRPLALRRGTLVMGCWNSEVIPALRASAAQVWPQLQGRITQGLKLEIRALDIVPCDPPPPLAPVLQPPEEDPMLRALEALKAARNRGWTRPPR